MRIFFLPFYTLTLTVMTLKIVSNVRLLEAIDSGEVKKGCLSSKK